MMRNFHVFNFVRVLTFIMLFSSTAFARVATVPGTSHASSATLHLSPTPRFEITSMQRRQSQATASPEDPEDKVFSLKHLGAVVVSLVIFGIMGFWLYRKNKNRAQHPHPMPKMDTETDQ